MKTQTFPEIEAMWAESRRTGKRLKTLLIFLVVTQVLLMSYLFYGDAWGMTKDLWAVVEKICSLG